MTERVPLEARGRTIGKSAPRHWLSHEDVRAIVRQAKQRAEVAALDVIEAAIAWRDSAPASDAEPEAFEASVAAATDALERLAEAVDCYRAGSET